MRIYLTEKDIRMIKRAHKREYQIRQIRRWFRKDVKPILVRLLEVVFGLSIFLMLFWGCGFDSANFAPVFKMFLISAATATMAAGGIWVLGGGM